MKGGGRDKNRGAVEPASVTFVSGPSGDLPTRAGRPQAPGRGRRSLGTPPAPDPASRRRRRLCGRGPRPRRDEATRPARRARTPRWRGSRLPAPGSRGISGRGCARRGARARAGELRGARREGEPSGAPGRAGEGASGRAGAEGGGRGGVGAGPRRLRGARRGSGGPAWSAGPPGVICMLSQAPRRLPGARLARSLAQSVALGSCHRSAGAAPGSPRAGEPANRRRGREGGSPGGRERGRAPALPLPRRPPFLLPQVRPGPRSHLGNLGRRRGRVWHLRGGGPGLGRRRRGERRRKRRK